MFNVFEAYFRTRHGNRETVFIGDSKQSAVDEARKWSRVVGQATVQEICVFATHNGLAASVMYSETFEHGQPTGFPVSTNAPVLPCLGLSFESDGFNFA